MHAHEGLKYVHCSATLDGVWIICLRELLMLRMFKDIRRKWVILPKISFNLNDTDLKKLYITDLINCNDNFNFVSNG